MEKRVLAFIKEHNLLCVGDKVVIGLSGGADSVCLLLMLCSFSMKFSLKLYAVHINHGIRGLEADKDEEFCRRLCENNHIDFTAYHLDIPKYSLETGLSEEEAGRKLRYEYFAKAAEEYKADKIATAHHMDDSAETMLFNLFRGSALRGLSGIACKRNEIIRPLICLNRNDIEVYLKKKNQNYCIDSTNLSDNYSRNKIRHNIMDYAIKQFGTSVSNHMLDTAMYVRKVDEYLVHQAVAYLEDIVQYKDEKLILSKEKLNNTNDVLKPYIIAEAIRKYDILPESLGRKQLTAVASLSDVQTGRSINLKFGWKAESVYNDIIIHRDSDSQRYCDEVSVNSFPMKVLFGSPIHEYEFKLEKYDGNFEKISKATYTKCFDYDKINIHMVIRYVNSEDYLIINSSGEKQSINRYLINNKVPFADRKRTVVLADGHKIIWVIGMRISEDVKIDDKTVRMLMASRIN